VYSLAISLTIAYDVLPGGAQLITPATPLLTSHQVVLTNLQRDTDYVYSVFVTDAVGNTASINNLGFRTLAPTLVGDGTFQAPLLLQGGSSVHLTARAADIDQDGDKDIVLAVLSEMLIFFAVSEGSYSQTPVTLERGNRPLWLELVDLNADGMWDIVNQTADDDQVNVYFGNGDGTFQSKVSYQTGDLAGNNSTVTALRVVDINNDQILDVLSYSYNDNVISTFLGNGDGTLQPRVIFSTPTQTGRARSFEVADFNADGNLDLAVPASFSARVLIHLGNGDGTFQPNVDILPATVYTRMAGVADFNGDQILDVATYGDDLPEMMHTYFGQGDGTFVLGSVTATIGELMVLSVTDLNADGHQDIVGGSYFDPTVNVLLGNGDGTFVRSTFDAPNDLSPIYFDDLNGDGVPDMLIPDTESSTLGVYFQNTIQVTSP